MNTAQIAFAAVAVILSMVAGATMANFALSELRRKKLVSEMSGQGENGKLSALLIRGIRPLIPASKWILGKSPLISESIESATIMFAEKGVQICDEALLSDLLGASILSFAIGSILGSSPLFGLAIACIVFIGFLSFARNRFEKRNIAMREEIPEALRTLAMLFRSGHSLPQALHDSSRECRGYLSHLFSVASDRMEMGATPNEALAVMRGNPRAPELSFVAVALDIQHQSGGKISLVLESAMDSIEGELKLARSLRVQTAQAKLSASIVTIMPFVLIALFSLFSPDFLSPFFSSVLGMGVLAVALVMQFTGVLIVRKMLNVDGDRA